MTRPSPYSRILVISVALALVLTAFPSATNPKAVAAHSDLVISQVYGGGGNTGAPAALYTHDFIEVFNRGTAAQSLDGWSVQYASATGTSWQVTALSGTLDPGQYYLVQQAAGTGGSQPLPTPDATGTIPMAAGAGKVALVSSTPALSGACPAGVADLVGYGSAANCFEGTGPTPTLNNNTSAIRADGGCTDTDDNAADFGTVSPPTPRNTATALNPCDGTPPTAVTFAVWDFEGGTTEPSVDLTGNASAAAGTGLSGVGFVTGNPLPGGSSGTSWTASNWSLTGSPDGTKYFEFSVDLTDYANIGLAFAERRSGTGPQAMEIHYSTDGSAFAQIPATVTTIPNNTDWRAHSFDLSGLNSQIAGEESVAFRIFGYGATTTGGTWRIDDVTFTASEDAPSAAPQVVCPTGVRTVETYATQGAVSASIAEGEIVSLEVTSVTPAPADGEITLIEVMTGAQATAVLDVPADVAVPPITTAADVRPFSVEITATSDEGVTGSCTASVNVIPLVPIGTVQGVIADGQTSFTSPLLNAEVAVQAVVTQHTMEGNGNRGFFLQNRPGVADGDPRSSDGIFVFNGGFTTLRTDADGPARGEFGANWTVTLGDEVIVRGTVGQFFGMTQLAGASAFVWDRVDTSLDVETAVAIAEVDPPNDAGDSLRYFRRHLGMQLEVPAGSLVVNGRDVFSGTDAEVWAIRGDHPVAQRDDPYARRVFRDAHPLDNNPATNFDDGNGYRFVLGSFGVKGATNNPDAVLAPARTFDTITTANRGGVYLSFGKYTVNVVDQLALANGVDPAANAPVQPAQRDRELAVAAYNVENLYDFRDNPNSACDFPGNPGCVGDGSSVNPPFDYVPESDEEYQARLVRMAQQIIVDLHGPDVILVQETEAQDVCTVAAEWTPQTGPALGADRLDCDLVNSGTDNTRTDGRPDSLLELALVIAEQGGPMYDAAFDLDGGDLRGITTAYLYRTDRVELLPADPDDPVLGSSPTIVYDGAPLAFNADVQNPKALNAQLPPAVAATCTGSGPTACDGTNVFSRGPSVGLFRVWRDAIGLSSWTDLYLVNNHQSSGPNNRVLQRSEQARYNARIAEALLAADADARVVIGGDFNVFPRPDDPFAPGELIHPIIGVGPSDQLRALYESPLTNLYEFLVATYPASAYSFGFQGQAQTLDHVWVSSAQLDELVDFRSAKINVDWPADARGEEPAYGRFGASDHDPEAGRFGVISFDRVHALLDYLVDGGRLDASVAADIAERLGVAETHATAGRTSHAVRVLQSIVNQLSAPGGGGLQPGVAPALRAEVQLLIWLVSG